MCNIMPRTIYVSMFLFYLAPLWNMLGIDSNIQHPTSTVSWVSFSLLVLFLYVVKLGSPKDLDFLGNGPLHAMFFALCA